MPSAIGGLPAWFVDHAERISRCHPPSAVPPTVCGAIHRGVDRVPGTQFGQRAGYAASQGRADRLPVPPSVDCQHVAWQVVWSVLLLFDNKRESRRGVAVAGTWRMSHRSDARPFTGVAGVPSFRDRRATVRDVLRRKPDLCWV